VFACDSWRTGSTRLIVSRKPCALLLSAWTKPFSFSSSLKSSTVTFSSWRKETIRSAAIFPCSQYACFALKCATIKCLFVMLLVFYRAMHPRYQPWACVCPSVRHKSVFCRNGCKNRPGFGMWASFYCVKRKFGYPQKYGHFPLEFCPEVRTLKISPWHIDHRNVLST